MYTIIELLSYSTNRTIVLTDAIDSMSKLSLSLSLSLSLVWFVRLGRPKEQEIRSLSYMYGPDHELSNLRSAYRHEQAQNPHYTWWADLS